MKTSYESIVLCKVDMPNLVCNPKQIHIFKWCIVRV